MWTIAILGHPTLSPTEKNVGVAISIHMNVISWSRNAARRRFWTRRAIPATDPYGYLRKIKQRTLHQYGRSG
jgi:hypothetical protein